MEFIMFLAYKTTNIAPIMMGGAATEIHRQEIVSAIAGSTVGKFALLLKKIIDGKGATDTIADIYYSVRGTLSPKHMEDSYDQINKVFFNVQDATLKFKPDEPSIVWNIFNKIVDVASYGIQTARDLTSGSTDRAFVAELEGKIKSSDIMVSGALLQISTLIVVIIVLWALYLIIGQISYSNVESRMKIREQEHRQRLEQAGHDLPMLDSLYFAFQDKNKRKVASKRKAVSKHKTSKRKVASKHKTSKRKVASKHKTSKRKVASKHRR